MNNKLEKYIEHTILKPTATIEDIKKHLEEALKYNFFGVCINPVYLSFAKDYLKDFNVKLVTVIGFPLGANTTEVKVFEAEDAVKKGADELDMVINIGSIKSKNFSFAESEVKKVVETAGTIPVKVIIETDLLDKTEIIEACKVCANAGASFVKTSTGFVPNGVGATVENVRIMYDTVKQYGLGVKASGGVKNKEALLSMINAGASRIGTSSGVNIINSL